MGRVLFDRDIALESLDSFLNIYAGRPFRINTHGMRLNHSFALWAMLRKLQPACIIESGVYRGHSTWLIEQACPNARIISIDRDLSPLAYRSPRASYIEGDFLRQDWSGIDKDTTLCLFDDHQNAYERLMQMHWLGFRRAIFDDNYDCGAGDCYSLRKIRGHCGHNHYRGRHDRKAGLLKAMRSLWIERILSRLDVRQTIIVPPNTSDADNLHRHCRLYEEFPPMALNADHATDAPPPLYAIGDLPPALAALHREDPRAFSYFNICYVELG